MSNEPSELEVQISAGKKKFKVEFENNAYTLTESGSIAAIIKKDENGEWSLGAGSYSKEDAQLIGRLIEEKGL